MEEAFASFINYIESEKQYSKYTVANYQEDLKEFQKFLIREHITSLKEIEYTTIRNYFMYLYEKKYAKKTISRYISTLRSCFKYFTEEEMISDNPTLLISNPKLDKKLPHYLNELEIEQLLDSEKDSTPLSIRNETIMEFLYSTGVRVSELISVRVSDVQRQEKKLVVLGKGNKERVVLYGKRLEELIEWYLKELKGDSFELHVLGEKVLLLEKYYSEVETFTEKTQLGIWSDRLANEAMRIINENFPFWTKMFAKLFWCNASDEIKGKAMYAATILDNIKKLFNCSNKMEKKIEKESNALAKFEPPLLIAVPGGILGGGIIGMTFVIWLPIRCILWGLLSILGIKKILGDIDTFLMKCAINSGMSIIASLPLWLTPLMLLGIISVETLFIVLIWFAIFAFVICKI